MAEVADLLTRLDKVSGKHPTWKARCPAHKDNSPSLHITQADDGRILIYCFAGCGTGDVMDAIGMSLSDLFPTGRLGHYMPGKNHKHRNSETVYGVPGAAELKRENEELKRKIKRLEAGG
jgi:DNA primase